MRSWLGMRRVLGLLGGAVLLLAPGLAKATPADISDDTQYFKLPYFEPGNPLDLDGHTQYGVNAPDVYYAYLDIHPYVKLVFDTDYDLTANSVLADALDAALIPSASETAAIPYVFSFDVDFNGTIGGVAAATFEANYCATVVGPCSLAPRILFSIFRVRYDPSGAPLPFTVAGGFDADGFVGAVHAGPTLIFDIQDDLSGDPDLCPANGCAGRLGYISETTGDVGVGFKLDLDTDMTLDATWYLAQNIGAGSYAVGFAAFVWFVPEPSSLLLAVSALAGVAVLGRRRA